MVPPHKVELIGHPPLEQYSRVSPACSKVQIGPGRGSAWGSRPHIRSAVPFSPTIQKLPVNIIRDIRFKYSMPGEPALSAALQSQARAPCPDGGPAMTRQ